ncbi:methylated-DNA--protein-cysteine methyltransferase [Malaciobacter pacificus]|uniref:methylated-DNA--[protein]-cysteine S-methyltransferase n=1 Tax=Malaciobacter pacificus TaxID=1080223 RepID=A0A5C2H802_9BACT|nr:methylated-DNA--[protein]-cysteine S-methyltransferase [Malaciobacter pacificus]QEP35067.1 O6-alkylguanine-DNA-alkyltransferase [Malaciobacter pacificus]GGD48382.1 methylated-DNA--protein-cysteine methyltransferase [Malaciobacter pacificus]
MREYKAKTTDIITTTSFHTPLGELFAAASKKGIVMLSFLEKYTLQSKVDILKKTLDCEIIPVNSNEIFEVLKTQLEEYFNNKREAFDIPMQMVGTSFQIEVWKELLKIPYNQTMSYKQIATNIGNENASRAVAKAISQNIIPILIPCHRVISSTGDISGYNQGIQRKEFLLKLEQNDR